MFVLSKCVLTKKKKGNRPPPTTVLTQYNNLLNRKLLLQDINDLRYQQEELKKALSGNSETEEGKKEDAVILKIALK